MEKRAPLKLIAEMLGISKMTVSRALREGTSVDAEVRRLVRETAHRLGYEPDTRISQVMSAIRRSEAPQYRENLAFIWTNRSRERGEVSSFLEEEFKGARRRAQQLGYKVDEFYTSEESLNGATLSRILQSRGIRAALIGPPGFERTHAHIWLDWKQFCCVLLGRSLANVGLARVEHDHYFGCVLAVRRLKRMRYTHIGLVISHSMDERSARLVRSAFLSFHPLGAKEAQRLIFTSNKYDAKALKKWITQNRPDILLANFEEAFPRVEQLSENAPSGLALATLNWSGHRPEIAGVNQHCATIGEQAIDLLLLRLQGNQFGLDPMAPSIKVPGSWVDSPSLPALKAAQPSRRKQGRL
jgi:DNA-binding LacI/PurR family transcriptional regulator